MNELTADHGQHELAAAAENLAVPMAVFRGEDGSVIGSNVAFRHLTELTAQTAANYTMADILIKSTDGKIRTLIKHIRLSEDDGHLGPWRGDGKIKSDKWGLVDVFLTVSRYGDSGQERYVAAINTSPTEKCLSCHIHVSREKYRREVDSQPDLICRILPDSRVVFANEAFAAAHDALPYQIVGQRLTDLLDDAASQRLVSWLKTVEARRDVTDSLETFELPTTLDDDDRATGLQWWRRATFGPAGDLLSIQSIGRAVSRDVRLGGSSSFPDAESSLQRLRESQQQQRLFFNALDEGLALFDAFGELVDINPAAELLLGLPVKEDSVRTRRDLDLGFVDVDGRLVEQRQLPLSLALKKGQRVEGTVLGIRLRDGEMRWLRVNAQPIQLPGRSAAGALVSFADVTELTLAVDDLRKAKALAAASNATKTQFLANMSHELRTPLNAILGYSETLMRQIFGPLDPRVTEYARDINSAGGHLLKLVDDILEISCVEMGKVRISNDDVDVSEIVQEARVILSSSSLLHKVQVNFEKDPVISSWFGDRHRLLQIIINLASNGIKFSSEGSEVAVELGPLLDDEGTSVGLTIRVSDNGKGISADDLETIWEPFQQVEGAMSRSNGGAGLGLSIVRNIVTAYEGKVEVQSTLGAGTTFVVKLPDAKHASHFATSN